MAYILSCPVCAAVVVPGEAGAIFAGPMIATMIYGGLLASAAAFFVNQALSNAPLTLNLSRPHVAGGMWPMMLVLGLAVFGFYASRSGQPLFGRLLRTD